MLVRKSETEAYPAIRAEAKWVQAAIYCGDESSIHSNYHTATT